MIRTNFGNLERGQSNLSRWG